MEADWEVEIGGRAPIIDADWEGLVDLRSSPERAAQLPETSLAPGLAGALARLNGPCSPVWTSKCDVWQPDSFDPDELDASRQTASSALACYVDLLPRSPWATHDQAGAACRNLCALLSSSRLRNCRVDLVIREAVGAAAEATLGITTYVTACASTPAAAAATLGLALDEFVGCVLHASPLQS